MHMLVPVDPTAGPGAPEAMTNCPDGESLGFFLYVVHVFTWMHASFQTT